MFFYRLRLTCLCVMITLCSATAFTQNVQIKTDLTPPTVSTESCAFDQIHQEMMQNDPVYFQKTTRFNTMMQSYVPSISKASQTQYKVPVVVHVMETGNALTAITDAQIRQAIQQLNERYRKVPGSMGDGME